jgi:hypothetical protein
MAGCGGGEEIPALRYGEDVCAACGMDVTDPAFAALAVTSEGERRPYDSIECAVRDLRAHDPSLRGEVLLPDHADPGTLHPWRAMTVVRADYPSPMGGGYAAFVDARTAAAEAESRGGTSGSLQGFVEGTVGP